MNGFTLCKRCTRQTPTNNNNNTHWLEWVETSTVFLNCSVQQLTDHFHYGELWRFIHFMALNRLLFAPEERNENGQKINLLHNFLWNLLIFHLNNFKTYFTDPYLTKWPNYSYSFPLPPHIELFSDGMHKCLFGHSQFLLLKTNYS